MKSPSLRQLGCFLILSSAPLACASWANPVAAVQLLRVSGCGGIFPAAPRLQHDARLDQAAAIWAAGGSARSAAARSGYRARAASGLRFSGPDDSILQALRRAGCRGLDDRTLRDVGIYRRGRLTWMLIAAPVPAASRAPAPEPPANEPTARAFPYAAAQSAAGTSSSAARVLQLVNEVRATGSKCGGRPFGPVAPLQGSGTLDGVAADHALDMARHDYFEHVDLKGQTPADRVRAIGYREKLVGENIAYGPTTAAEVVAGWLHSTGHCENIMDPRFVEMGLATASGHGSRRGLYWDQVLTEPAN